MERYKQQAIIYESCFKEEKQEESIKYKKVVRKGKTVRKPVSTNPKARITYVNGKPKEKVMGSSERNKLSRQNRKSARKAKPHLKAANRKRSKSLKKHTW